MHLDNDLLPNRAEWMLGVAHTNQSEITGCAAREIGVKFQKSGQQSVAHTPRSKATATSDALAGRVRVNSRSDSRRGASSLAVSNL